MQHVLLHQDCLLKGFEVYVEVGPHQLVVDLVIYRETRAGFLPLRLQVGNFGDGHDFEPSAKVVDDALQILLILFLVWGEYVGPIKVVKQLFVFLLHHLELVLNTLSFLPLLVKPQPPSAHFFVCHPPQLFVLQILSAPMQLCLPDRGLVLQLLVLDSQLAYIVPRVSELLVEGLELESLDLILLLQLGLLSQVGD